MTARSVVAQCPDPIDPTLGCISYQVGAGPVVTVESEQDITIDVGVVSGVDPLMVRIWDPVLSAGQPNDGVGRVTIRGTDGGGELRILLLRPSIFSPEDWPVNPFSFLFGAVALRDFGLNASDGLFFVDASGNPNPALRDRARLAGFVSDDINGSITVGQVQRVQAGFRPPGGIPNPGTIHAAITSTTQDNLFGEFQPSIGYISAGNAITGTISATSAVFNPADAFPYTTYASIQRVVVGPSSEAAGITGNILAENGRIFSISSAGNIGAAAAPVNIRAANGIEEIRTASEDPFIGGAFDLVFGKNIHANINAKVNYTPTGDYAREGAMVFLECGGDLTGSVQADNLHGLGAPGSSLNGAPGIMVQGTVHGPITINHAVVHSNIVASDFRQPILIGRHLSGSVVAYGKPTTENPLAGTMVSVTIGRNESLDFPIPERGFSAVRAELINLDPAIPDLQRWFQNYGDFGAIDSLIRAEQSIGSVDVFRMGQRWIVGQGQKGRARIESPVIGSLIVGEMGAGAIWSGRLEYAAGVVANDPANDYAQTGTATLGCVSPTADVWFMGCPLLLVTGDMMGELHVPSLASNETIRINGQLADLHSADCDCMGTAPRDCVEGNAGITECGYLVTRLSEVSPRGFPAWAEETFENEGVACRAAIDVRESAGLHGQIIVDANNTGPQRPATHFKGFVRIGEGTGALDFDTQSTTPIATRIPDYAASPSTLGGGAIGLVPFARHAVGDSPAIGQNNPSDPTGPGARAVGAFFASDHSGEVAINFYGPLADARPGDGLPPVVIEWEAYLGEGYADVTAEFDVVLGPGAGGLGHAIRLRPASSAARFNFPIGLFRVRPRVDAATGLSDVLCGGLPTGVVARATWGAAEAYAFIVFSDCDGNGVLSDPELRAVRTADCGDPISITPNGVDDVCDIILPPPSGGAVDTNFDGFIDNSCPGTCPADFNRDDNVDPDDLSDYIACYFASPSCARGDVNGDGFIDPDDLADFIAAFFAGCP